MAKRKAVDPIPELVVAARLLLAVQLKATTGQRAVSFLAAAGAELLSIAGGKLEVAQHKERFETFLDQPEVKIGNAFADAMVEAGPLFCSAVLTRLAKNMFSVKGLMKLDLNEFKQNN